MYLGVLNAVMALRNGLGCDDRSLGRLKVFLFLIHQQGEH